MGKDAVIAKLLQKGLPLEHTITVTTRPKRPEEKNGVDYHFVSDSEFQGMIKNDELLEWANVYGNWYGVPRKPIKEALARGRDVILKVDIQGAATIKEKVPQAIFVFVAPSSLEELRDRLKERNTESPADLALRLKTAEQEMEQLPLFDYVVVNKQDQIDLAVSDIEAIITTEKCRVHPREVTL